MSSFLSGAFFLTMGAIAGLSSMMTWNLQRRARAEHDDPVPRWRIALIVTVTAALLGSGCVLIALGR